MNPSCPCCGYDQSGAIAAWNHAASRSCPLRGTCSECGAELWWGDVFRSVAYFAQDRSRRWPGWLVVPALFLAAIAVLALMIWGLNGLDR